MQALDMPYLRLSENIMENKIVSKVGTHHMKLGYSESTSRSKTRIDKAIKSEL